VVGPGDLLKFGLCTVAVGTGYVAAVKKPTSVDVGVGKN
jgi:hypothetical protein